MTNRLPPPTRWRGGEVNLGVGGEEKAGGRRRTRPRTSSERVQRGLAADIIGYQEWEWQADGANGGDRQV